MRESEGQGPVGSEMEPRSYCYFYSLPDVAVRIALVDSLMCFVK